ncbi:MAG: ComEC family competence protein [Sediminibacterium sp.]|nr:ComEC family competence protein [Sediminibacterium sp.]
MRILFPLLIGIGVSLNKIPLPAPYFLCALIILFLLCTEWITINQQFRFRWLRGWWIQCIFLLIGYARTADYQSVANREHPPTQSIVTVAVKYQGPPEQYTHTIQGNANLELWTINHQIMRHPQKVLLQFDKNDTTHFPVNATIVGKAILTPIQPTRNPGAFNAAVYYGNNQIYYRCKFISGTFRIVEPASSNNPVSIVFAIKQYCLTTLEKYLHPKNELAIAQALLIGYKKNLPNELTEAYSKTGIIHIIAISGMHMAMLFGLLKMLLSLIPKKLSNPFLLLMIQWVCIGIFTWITGASASVLRAACIFSAIGLGEALQRKHQPVNTLAGSAIGLLFYNPLFIIDAGFLLSYAAVIGILYLSKPITHLLYISNPLLQKIWQMNAVTLAAQIATLPLILYFFHRFPLLFLFTNCIAIPLSTIILYATILLIIIAPIDLFAKITASVTEWMIRIMNQWIVSTQQIPNSSIDGIYISEVQTILLLTTIIFLYMAFQYRNKSGIWLGLTCLLLVIGEHGWRQYERSKQIKWIIYQLNGKTAVHLIAGKQQYLLHDTTLINHKETIQFKKTAEWYFGTTEYTFPKVFRYKYPTIEFEQNRLAIISGNDRLALQKLPKTVNCILLTKNAAVSLPELLQYTRCSHFIFDGSNPMWKINAWKKQAEQLHLHLYSTPEQGALTISL